MSISTTTPSASTTRTQSQRLTAAISAMILGACLVYFAGFSHIAAVRRVKREAGASCSTTSPALPPQR